MPFAKGQSGNPLGHPKRTKIISEELNKELLRIDKDDRTKARKIAEKLVALAVMGDVRAAEIVLERAEGKVAQDINLNVEDAFSNFISSLGTTQTEVSGVESESSSICH